MNKLAFGLLLLSLLSPSIFAEENIPVEEESSSIFLGVDYFQGESKISADIGFATFKEEFDQSGFRIKFGVQNENNIRFQGYIKSEDFEDAFDDKVYGFGADAIFTFPVKPNFRPYFLVGFSSDFTKLDDEGIEYSEDTLNALALKIGVGALFRVNKHIEFQTGYDIQHRTWQDIKVIDSISGRTAEIEQDDKSRTFYAGLNFFF
jgi:hypothetical protein